MNDRAPDSPQRSAPKPRRSGTRRWARRILVAIPLVLILAIIGGQIILWTDVPRRIVVSEVQRQLGLTISAASLSTGWFGHTVLRDVNVSLPLAEEAILVMPRMDVEHTSLIGLIFNRPMRLETIALRQPTLIVRQSRAGRWNVQEAIELIARVTAKPQPEPGPRITARAIPELNIRNGTIRIIDMAGHEANITAMHVTGRRAGQLVYRYEGGADERLGLRGELVPGDLWQHEFLVSLSKADHWVKPFIPIWPDETHVQARWRGQFNEGGVRGRLLVESFRAGEIAMKGALLASMAEGRLSVQPQRLLVDTGNPLTPQVLVHSGSIVLEADTLRADELRLAANGGVAIINATWERANDTAAFDAVWRDIQHADVVHHSGQIHATLQRVFPGQPRVQATITSTGQTLAVGHWDAQLRIDGQGESFGDMTWDAAFTRARHDWRRELNLDGLQLQVRMHRGRPDPDDPLVSDEHTLVTLENVELPEHGQLDGRGQLNLDTKRWWLWLSGGEFTIVRFADAALTFDLDTWGDFNSIEVKSAYLRTGDLELSLYGSFDNHRPQPVDLQVYLTHFPPSGEEVSPHIRGTLVAEAQLVGTARPLKLGLEGDLYARDLYIRQRSLGDIVAEMKGEITAEWVHVHTQQLELLEASWDIDGRWPTAPDRAVELIVKVDDLSLAEVGNIFNDERLTGTASADVRFEITRMRLEQIEAKGAFRATGVGFDPLAAEQVSGEMSLSRGWLRIDPIKLRQRDGSGSAEVHAHLRRLHELDLRVALEDWPIELAEESSIIASGQTERILIDFNDQTVRGDGRFQARFSQRDTEVGTARTHVSAAGTIVRVNELDASVLGGSVTGTGTFDWDDPLRTRGELRWVGINADRINHWVPQLDGLSGLVNGDLRIAPSDDPRALGPLRIDLSVRSSDGGFRALEFNSIDAIIFCDLKPEDDRTGERWRIVAQNADLRFADGKANVFARLTRRWDGTVSAQTMVEFQQLSLEQIVHAAAPDYDQEMPGRLTGNVTLAGDPRPDPQRPREVFGDINVTLSDADLINFDPVGVLYDLMRVDTSRAQPTGTGHVLARLENETIQISDVYLFNRGVEIRGVGAIERVLDIPHSPISGVLVGSARPLRDLRLPFMADVDQIFAALQTQATTVEVTGMLREPNVRPTTLDEVGDAVRVLLLGDVRRGRGR